MFRNSFGGVNNIIKKRHFSCNYNYNKPLFSPLFSSIFAGSVFTFLLLESIQSNHVQIITKLYKLEQDINKIKKNDNSNKTK